MAAPHPLIAAALAAGRRTLGERESKVILAELGFPVTREVLATSADEAVAAARAIGWPVALKGEHPGIAHKTEAGLVRLGLATADDVAAAYAAIDATMRRHPATTGAVGVLVQEMVPAGTELVLGVQSDLTFGPAVMFGLGGIFVEVLRDVRVAIVPLDRTDALALIRGTRCVALLEGARGRHRVDLDALADLVVALSAFAADHSAYVREIDVNPLIAIDRAIDNLRVVDALFVLNA
jgi:succinyl-CoA synthetase beta subunit